jgi:hypothetical protein
VQIGGCVDMLELRMALHFMYYNFVRIHQTLRTAMAWENSAGD